MRVAREVLYSCVVDKQQNQRGFALIDLLAAVTILAIILVAINANAILAFTVFGKITRDSITDELARDRMEQLAAVDPAILDDSYNALEMGIRVEGMEFLRQTEITVAANQLRLVRITARAMAGKIPAERVIEAAFAPKEGL